MRNGVRVEEDSNHMTSQIIVDTSTDNVYNNTLRVRGRESGTYKCIVSSLRHDQEHAISTSRRIQGMVIQILLQLYIRIFSFQSGHGASKPECYLQVTYQDFTGVDICFHTHLPIFLCGILSVWRRGLQCGLHH